MRGKSLRPHMEGGAGLKRLRAEWGGVEHLSKLFTKVAHRIFRHAETEVTGGLPPPFSPSLCWKYELRGGDSPLCLLLSPQKNGRATERILVRCTRFERRFEPPSPSLPLRPLSAVVCGQHPFLAPEQLLLRPKRGCGRRTTSRSASPPPSDSYSVGGVADASHPKAGGVGRVDSEVQVDSVADLAVPVVVLLSPEHNDEVMWPKDADPRPTRRGRQVPLRDGEVRLLLRSKRHADGEEKVEVRTTAEDGEEAHFQLRHRFSEVAAPGLAEVVHQETADETLGAKVR